MGVTERPDRSTTAARGAGSAPGSLAQSAPPLQVELIESPSDRSCQVRLVGDLDLETVPLFDRHAADLVRDGSTALVIDAQQLRFVDSSGLACLFSLERRVRRLLLLKPHQAVEELVSLMGVTDLLQPVTDYRCALFREELGSIAAARRLATELVLDEADTVRANVALVVSELATNAVRHAGSAFEIELIRERRGLMVAVRDFGQGRPVPATPHPEDLSGRGLQIVENLATAWGVEMEPSGKVVWAVVALDD